MDVPLDVTTPAEPRLPVECADGRTSPTHVALLNKIYAVLPDDDAEHDGDLRVIDESGEDYLFSADCFIAIELPAVVRESVLRSS